MAEKRIGILTSGGDCAGLNAALRAVVHRAIRGYGWRVFGIRDGSLGLMNRPLGYVEFDLSIASGEMLRQGGTILGTINKGDPFAYPMPDGSKKDRSQDFVEGFRELELDALIVIGGDGSMRILNKLCKMGCVPMVGIPKTIDNDVAHTDYAIGYVTALGVATEAIDRLAPTAASHHRVMILEVMGRDVGHIALSSGIGGGADVVLIPEIPYSLEGIAAKIEEVRNEGRNHALVVVAEGCKTECGKSVSQMQTGGEVRYGGIGQYLAAKLAPMVDAETRVTVLGHVQRGGSPVPSDRILGSRFGVAAMDAVSAGETSVMTALRGEEIVLVPISEVEGRRKDVPADLIRAANLLA